MLHVFEQSNLGRPPYTFQGVTAEPGHCQFCGTSIDWRFNYVSACGKQFFVGCECSKKSAQPTGQKQLTLIGV